MKILLKTIAVDELLQQMGRDSTKISDVINFGYAQFKFMKYGLLFYGLWTTPSFYLPTPLYEKKAVSLLTLTFSTLIDANSRIKNLFIEFNLYLYSKLKTSRPTVARKKAKTVSVTWVLGSGSDGCWKYLWVVKCERVSPSSIISGCEKNVRRRSDQPRSFFSSIVCILFNRNRMITRYDERS